VEIDVGPSQGAKFASPGSGSSGEAKHGGEVVIDAAGLDEPLPVSRRGREGPLVMHRRWRRQCRRVALEPTPFSSLFERPSQPAWTWRIDEADKPLRCRKPV
jgi:hypothetical protein